MASLADINKSLQEQTSVISAVDQNTQQTSGAINKFIKYMEGKRGDELETQREIKRSFSKRAVDSAKKAGGAVKDSIGGLSKLDMATMAALPAAFMSRAVRRGIPALLGVTFADEIADYLLGPEGDAELKKQLEMAITGGSIGLIFGKKFGILGAALGYLSTDDKLVSEVDRLASGAYDLAEKLGIGAFFNEQSFAAFAKGLADTIGSGIGAFADLLEGDFKGFFSDIDDALITLGTLSLLISPRLTTKAGKSTMRGLLQAFKKAGPIGKAVAAVGLAMGLDAATGSSDEGLGVEDAGYAAAAGYAGYQGFKAIKNAGNRQAPDAAQVKEQISSNARGGQHPNFGKIVERHGQQYVTDSKGKLHLRGSAQANMIETRGGTQKMPNYSKYPKFKMLKALGRAWPLGVLFAALETKEALDVWNDESLDDDTRATLLGGIVGRNVGSAAFAAMGGVLGTAFGGVPGMFIGSLLGGVGGYVSGEYAGQKLMQFMLGQYTPTDQDLEKLYAEKYKGYESIGMGGVGLRAANQFERVYSDRDVDDLTGGNYVTTTPTKPPIDSGVSSGAAQMYKDPIMQLGTAPTITGQIGDNVVSNNAFNNLPQSAVDPFDNNSMLWGAAVP